MKCPAYSLKLTNFLRSAVLAMFTFSLCWVPIAMAQTGSSDEQGFSTLSLGMGVAVVKKPYRDNDNDDDVLPLPLFSYENRWVSASVPNLDIKLLYSESVTLSLRARYAGDGYNADDSPYLAGMNDRKGSIWAGGTIIWKAGIADLSAEVLGDVSGNSKGSRAKLQAERRLSSGAFGITPRLAVARVDRKFTDYYYGVKTAEVRPNRSLYEGESAINVETGVRMDYTFARHHTLFLDASITRFGKAIKDSPLVDNSSQTMMGVGYLYRF